MKTSSYYAEIFGMDALDSVAPVLHSKPVPDVPFLDDATTDYRKSAGAADQLCKKLEDSALVSELVGPVTDISGQVFTPSAHAIINRKSAAFSEDFLAEILPTANALASLAPNAVRQFGNLLKSTARKKKVEPICWGCMETVNDCECAA